MTNEIRQEIFDRCRVTSTMQLLIDRCNADLYSGPLYLNREGEPVSMFDSDYDHAFDFSRAGQILARAWEKRGRDDFLFESWSGCMVTEIDPTEPWGCVRINAKEIIFGAELARFI